MKCDNCGNQHAAILKVKWEDGGVIENCDRCGAHKCSLPSVYFRTPYFDPNLGDDKHPHGQFVHSKEHKARIMKEQGLVEYGDRRHGARNYEEGYGGKR